MATARAGNVIGGGDWSEDRLVPDIVDSALTQTPLRIRSPLAVRPWQHVLDPLYGYLKIIANLDSTVSQQWNIGPYSHESCNVGDFVEAFISAWTEHSEQPIQVEIDTGQQPPESTLLRLDTTKTNTLLQWLPALSFQESVRWTARWYALAGTNKPATLETGATIQVPVFVTEGERIRVDTRTAKYVERVKG